VDAAQTAGAWPVDLVADHIDLLALTGHKSLLGPMGTGALVIGARVEDQALEPLKHGGTGSRSEHEVQPEFLPDRLESGTPNAMGLAGLAAGVRWILDRGVSEIRDHEAALLARLLAGLEEIPGVSILGPTQGVARTAVVSFNLEGQASSEVGLRLDDGFDVLCRVGLHCSPAAHRTIGTHPHGTVRFSLGAFTTEGEIDRALEAVRTIAGETS
jgi:selenocysteine lyase/cysteine desulfurase